MALTPGQTLDGKYRIVKLIGEGGMGSVFEGLNVLINRKVAIKVLHGAAAGNEQVLRRFEREAQAAGTIGSDHILEVIDLGMLPDGDRYMVMEFLEGEELSARIKRKGTLAPAEIAALIRQTLVGLKAAHAAQIIHRDLKPDNIFVLREKAGRPDFVKIIDFGISKFNALAGDMSMTTTGAVMGTPYYMSPEQAKGSANVDARTDIYAVGVIMYQALTGHVPFDGTSFNDLMFKIVLAETPELPDDVPVAFRNIVRKSMARDVKDRYQSAEDFIGAIDLFLAGGDPEGLASADSELSNTAPGGLATEKQAESLAKSVPTEGNFVKTHAGPPSPTLPTKKANLPVLIGAAALGLTGLLVVAFVGDGGDDEEKSTPAASEEGAQAVVEPAPAKEDKVEAPAVEKAEPARDEPKADAADAKNKAAATKEAAVKDGALADSSTSKPVVKASPVPAPRPATAPASKPKSTPTPPARRDFGY